MGALGGVDNGAMRFYSCRIPRSHMFAGAASVSRDGIYTAAKDRNHSFTSMVIIRGLLSDDLGLDMAKALYIAAKYTGFQRQFGATDRGQETRVIDYGSVQYRLYPSIARISIEKFFSLIAFLLTILAYGLLRLW
jgi:acyl-CoA oxidase